MKAQERARNLLARRRQQLDHRRATMLGRSGQEVNRPTPDDSIQTFS